jgi:hypothetical protein
MNDCEIIKKYKNGIVLVRKKNGKLVYKDGIKGKPINDDEYDIALSFDTNDEALVRKYLPKVRTDVVKSDGSIRFGFKHYNVTNRILENFYVVTNNRNRMAVIDINNFKTGFKFTSFKVLNNKLYAFKKSKIFEVQKKCYLIKIK